MRFFRNAKKKKKLVESMSGRLTSTIGKSISVISSSTHYSDQSRAIQTPGPTASLYNIQIRAWATRVHYSLRFVLFYTTSHHSKIKDCVTVQCVVSMWTPIGTTRFVDSAECKPMKCWKICKLDGGLFGFRSLSVLYETCLIIYNNSWTLRFLELTRTFNLNVGFIR